MHLLNLEHQLAVTDDVEIEIMPHRQRGDFQARKCGQWAEVEAVYRQEEIVEQQRDNEHGDDLAP